MKKLIALCFTVAVVGFLNVGCTAHAGIHTTQAAKVHSSQQVAYLTAPSR